MALQPITFAMVWPSPPPTVVAERPGALDAASCIHCGVRSGAWQLAEPSPPGKPSTLLAVCPLCTLSLHLERPQIDDEAVLTWLPEMSQPAINTLMRELHMRLRALDEGLHPADPFRAASVDRATLHDTRAALASRSAAAQHRLGTTSPGELGRALLRLSPGAAARQAKLLAGVRLLPLGRFYAGGRDIYPSIVDSWIALAQPAASSEGSAAVHPRPIQASR